jgi:hypothetical protein
MATANENPITISAEAQAALDTLANTDPVLAPLDLTTLLALANTIADGIAVDGQV